MVLVIPMYYVTLKTFIQQIIYSKRVHEEADALIQTSSLTSKYSIVFGES